MSASGSHVTKAVTVVELLKRRIPVSELYRYPPNSIGLQIDTH